MNPPADQPAPNFVNCPCQYCSGKIEFDANQLDAAANTTVPCPHCGLETIIFVPEQKVPPVISDIKSLPSRIGQVLSRFSHKTGDAQWESDLGIAYFRQKNYSDAAKCFAKAAEQGNDQAEWLLGICYMDGMGVLKDEAEAVKWFSIAAEKGHSSAEYSLGAAYLFGKGVPEDFSVALKWWHKAAEHGNADAQFRLGIYYENLAGVAQDYGEAYKWMKLAAAQGYEGAQKKCEELVLKMNAEQVKVVEPADQMLWQREHQTPMLFSEFIGQPKVKERLEIAVAAAKKRKEALDHILLVGPPGLGKATLAYILARAMGTNIKSTSGPTIEKAGDLAGLLTNLEEGDVLFIDEIHRLQKTIEEYLCPALEDFQLDVIIDQGPNARSVHLNLPRFTLIGTTPRKERLPTALLSCFSIIENMDAYSVEELTAIAHRFAKSLQVEIDAGAAERIARSADGTPLDVLRRLRRVRDYAHVKGSSEIITADITAEALKMLLPPDETREANEGRAAIPSDVRREVWRRDGGKCVKCGSRKNLEYDHIVPVSKGGSNTARNIELLCEKHNREKRDSIQ
jgi:Holliday junction DNA helicase RuvB subunit